MLIARLGVGKIMLASVGLLGALMLLPSGESSPQQAAPQERNILSTSPELTRFLDNAVQVQPATRTAAEVVAEVAAAPEPGSATPVSGLDVPTAPEDLVASTATTIPEDSELTPVRTAVNMRSGPSTSYSTLFVLQPDEQVAILERQGGWARVAKTNGTTGWVYGSYLGANDVDTTATASVTQAKQPVRKARTETAPRANTTLATVGLRASPSTRSAIVMTVEPGTPLRVAERRNNWARVVVPGGMSGWVQTR
jgi:SH3-like domain-containing protein